MGQEASSATTPSPPPEALLPPAITVPPVPSHQFLHHTTLEPRPKLILIGDSITEQGSSHANGWVTSLSIRYSRRADVVNRGMNGYNSRWGLACLPLILEEMLGPSHSVVDGVYEENGGCGAEDVVTNNLAVDTDNEDNQQSIQTDNSKLKEQQSIQRQHPTKEQSYPQYTFIIGFGANDSCLLHGAHSRHHVPLEEYKSNLKKMIQMIRTWTDNGSDYCSSTSLVSVALLTPPPCDTEKQKKSRHNEEVTNSYAQACLQVGKEMIVPVVDLWSGMQLPVENDSCAKDENFVGNEKWKTEYLSDGLHLTPMGNYRLYELVVEMLDRPGNPSHDADGKFSRNIVDDEIESGIGLEVTQLPRQYPDHSLVNAKNPEETFRNNADA